MSIFNLAVIIAWTQFNYWVTQKLPQICTVILRIRIGKVAWFAVYIAVTSGSPSKEQYLFIDLLNAFDYIVNSQKSDFFSSEKTNFHSCVRNMLPSVISTRITAVGRMWIQIWTNLADHFSCRNKIWILILFEIENLS